MNEMPFGTTEFKEAWNEWIQYRKERKVSKYTPTGLKRTFSALVRDSENNEGIAIKMIEQSIEKNWQGIFKIKENGINKITKPGTSEARVAALRQW